LEGADPLPRFVDLCLASPSLRHHVPADLRNRAQTLAWSHAPRLRNLDEDPRLVHCDFSRRNLLVRCDAGRWSVAAVLDWEFAVAGSPLIDFGNFLRYERGTRPLVEPHFSHGYRSAGGTLPEDWRALARIVDLTALCESLTRDELPDDVQRELIELVCSTVEDRDPQ
jgi:aminoglycoside phosphotransferase (APT) family kinase protein